MSTRGFVPLLTYRAIIDVASLARIASQSWVAYDLTGSSAWVGGMAGIRAIPVFLFPILAGPIIDRYDRRILISTVLVLQSIFAMLQAALIGTHRMELWHQMALAFVAGSGISIVGPAFWAIIAEMVAPKALPRVNGMLTFVTNTGEMTGPFLAGIIIAAEGVHFSFVFIAALYLIGALLFFRLPSKNSRQSDAEPVKTDQLPYIDSIREGIAYARHTEPIPWLFVMIASTNIFGVAIFPLIPEYAEEILKTGGFGFGLMMGVFGGGMAIGSAFIALTGMPSRLSFVMLTASIIWDLGMIAFGFSRVFPLTLTVLFFMGIAGMYWVNAALIMFQRAAVENMRGRVMSIYTMGMGLFPLGWAYGGALASWIGNEPALIISSLGGTPLVIAALVISPALRKS